MSQSLKESQHASLSGDDKNHCAIFTLNGYYTQETGSDRYTYYAWTKFTGGFVGRGESGSGSDVGENVKVKKLWLDIAQKGSDLDNGHFLADQELRDQSLPISRNWTYYPPSNWRPVSDAGFGSIVAVNYHFTLGRGAGSWESDPVEIVLSQTLNW